MGVGGCVCVCLPACVCLSVPMCISPPVCMALCGVNVPECICVRAWAGIGGRTGGQGSEALMSVNGGERAMFAAAIRTSAS